MALLGKAVAPFRQFGQADRTSLVGIEQTLVSTCESIQPCPKLLFCGLLSGRASFCGGNHVVELRNEPVRVGEHAGDMLPDRGFDFVGFDGAASSPSELRRQPGGLPDRYDGCGGGLEGRRRVLIRPAASDSRRDDPDHAATALMLAVGIPFGSQVAPARANIRFTL